MFVPEQFSTVVQAHASTAIVLFASGLATFAFLWVLGFKLVVRKRSGWSKIAARFPMGEIHPLGKEYRRQSGDLGGGHYNRGFTIQLAQEGMCVHPFFARHTPCLIPWASIQNVDVSDRCIFLVMKYDRPMQSFLPSDALQEVRAYVAPESLDKAVSVFEGMKSAIGAGVKPRWLWQNRK